MICGVYLKSESLLLKKLFILTESHLSEDGDLFFRNALMYFQGTSKLTDRLRTPTMSKRQRDQINMNKIRFETSGSHISAPYNRIKCIRTENEVNVETVCLGLCM